MEAKMFFLLLILTMDIVSGVKQEQRPTTYKTWTPHRKLITPGCTNCVDDTSNSSSAGIDWSASGQLGDNSRTIQLHQLGDKKYHVGFFVKLNWHKAQRYCRYLGLQLVSINSADEEKNVEKLIQIYDYDGGCDRKIRVSEASELPSEYIGVYEIDLNSDPLVYVSMSDTEKFCVWWNSWSDPLADNISRWNIGECKYNKTRGSLVRSISTFPCPSDVTTWQLYGPNGWQDMNETESLIEEVVEKDSVTGRPGYWTSGTDLGDEGNFYWMSTGRPLTFENWFRYYGFSANNNDDNRLPDDVRSKGENCLEIGGFRGLKWNDLSCYRDKIPICEE